MEIKKIILNGKSSISWLNKNINSDGDTEIIAGDDYMFGILSKILSEKLNETDKDILFYDLVFGNSSIVRIGGMNVKKIIN